MITWMQRHKKYLIVTIWISTIAFIGAGFVGWGQYSYGDKAGAVAKVGNIELTMGELQKSYSRLYSQYNQMLQGNFDEEKAKSFGLQAQAMQQIIQQAYILNLAAEYDLSVSDEELLTALKTQEYFFENGVFNSNVYKTVLSQNKLSIQEYENDLRKQLLIQKTFKLLPVEVSESESAILNTILSIADKIEYKILNLSDINVDSSDEQVKLFWETQKNNFMTEVSYDVKFIKQDNVKAEYTADEISTYYSENKTHFKDSEGKILSLENAKENILDELDAKASKDAALRTYIAYKKGTLDENVSIQTTTISNTNNPFDSATLEEIAKLTSASPFMKPVFVNGAYYMFELIKTNPSITKTYEEAKSEVKPLYITQTQKAKLLELATNSVATFKGSATDYVTVQDSAKIAGLSAEEASEFLAKLFDKQIKRSYITLSSGKVILYDILEQKLLDNSNNNQGDSVMRLKSAMFNEGLIKNLENEYQTEIFIQGL
ncbi:MAG: peptidylprolyl isomerase [Sulfurimonas sp.]|nr:peptidylprolyl isomerase [Sulfurimonas sp.]MBU1215930.1 SurA N-terminal domain-containing protein [bacterium]MBU1435609.1 SurA N-terminal domain-containing protein [bacterium]MBU1502467.1 SurA N-terminal domain-containing protein [bacterium]MBU3938110.1 SurA N-terminal domain-containing protein [bacterium]